MRALLDEYRVMEIPCIAAASRGRDIGRLEALKNVTSFWPATTSCFAHVCASMEPRTSPNPCIMHLQARDITSNIDILWEDWILQQPFANKPEPPATFAQNVFGCKRPIEVPPNVTTARHQSKKLPRSNPRGGVVKAQKCCFFLGSSIASQITRAKQPIHLKLLQPQRQQTFEESNKKHQQISARKKFVHLLEIKPPVWEYEEKSTHLRLPLTRD